MFAYPTTIMIKSQNKEKKRSKKNKKFENDVTIFVNKSPTLRTFFQVRVLQRPHTIKSCGMVQNNA